MALIEYLDKVALENDPEVATVNKVTDDDMNEIKNVVNENFTNEITIGDIEPTSESCKIWIDTDEIDGASSEIEVGSNEPTNPGCKLWVDPAEVKNAGSELHVGKNAPDNNYQRVWFAMGKNLFNNKIENGRWSIIVGDVIRPVTNAGLRSANAIEIQPNTTYTISATFYDGACFIIETDKDYKELAIDGDAPYKRFNFTIGERSSMTFTSHENAKYLYWYAPNATIMPTEFQVELGLNMTNYEAYITPSIQVDKNEIYSKEKTVHVGINLNDNYKTNILHSKNLFNENTYTNGLAWNNATGFPSRATAYLSITASKTYTISVSNISKLTGSPQVYIAEKTSIENANHTGNTLSITSNGNYTFTTTSSGKVLAVQLQMASGNISSTDYPNIMIVKGNTVQLYQPYVTPAINVDGEDIYVKGQNEVYSIQEQRIGTWLGKPLYRKVFEIPQTSINSSDVTVINFNLADTNYVTKIEGMIGVTTSNTYYPIFGSPNRANVGYQVRRVSSAIQIIVDQTMSAESSIKGGQMIVEYTKTTD